MKTKIPVVNHVERKRILPAALVTVAVSLVINLVTLGLLDVFIGYPAEFQPLKALPVAVFTLLGSAGAGAFFAFLAVKVRRVYFAFHVASVLVLYLSLQPNFALMSNPAAAPIPGGSALTYGLLAIFHVTTWLVCMVVLTFMTRKEGARFL